MKKNPGKHPPDPARQTGTPPKRNPFRQLPAIKEHRYRWLFEFMAIFLLVLVAYGNSIKNDYNLDDGYVVSLDEANTQTEKGIRGIPEILTSNYNEGPGVTYGYRPLGKVTMAIEYSMWGNNPHYSHFVNMLLYAINCFLLLLFIRKVAGLMHYSNEWVICLSVLLFILHPIHTEVVCSIKNREEILCFGFLLAALLAYFRYLDASAWISRQLYLLVFILSTILSLLSKQTGFNIFGIMAMISLYRFFREGDGASTFREKLWNKNTLAAAIALVAALACLSLVLDYIPGRLPASNMIQKFETSPYSFSQHGDRFPNFIQTVLFYCQKLLIPFPLLFYYGYDMLPDRSWDNSMYPYAGLVLLAGVLILTGYLLFKKRQFFPVFWIGFFGLTILPFSNIGVFFFYVVGIVGERFAYQASAGYCVLFVIVLYELTAWAKRKYFSKSSFSGAQLCFGAMMVVALPYLLITINRNSDWKDMSSLYGHDIKRLDRSVRANFMAGSQVMRAYESGSKPVPDDLSQVHLARHYFQHALELLPGYNDALLALGTLYGGYYKMPDSAVYFLEKVDTVSLHSYVKARERLGDIYYFSNNHDQALSFYQQAFFRYTQNYLLYQKINDILMADGRYEEVLLFSEIALRNHWPEGYVNKGDAYLGKKDTLLAVANYELAFRRGAQNKYAADFLHAYYGSGEKKGRPEILPPVK
jgi:tetratricopeptide (TPR) repeat protein